MQTQTEVIQCHITPPGWVSNESKGRINESSLQLN